VGESLEQACSRTILLEWLSALYFRARLLGRPSLPAAEEIERVGEKLRAARPALGARLSGR
jgi:ribulose-5-phosphate 4-epimerase/fuculose-1-phosphate aldolase